VSALTLRPPLPRSLYLETTSRCNSLCETCILTFGGREPAKDLGWDEFRVVDRFPALERVLCTVATAPRPRPGRMVAHLKTRGARALQFNAISLSERRGALIAAGSTSACPSTPTPQTYARIRGVTPSTRWCQHRAVLRPRGRGGRTPVSWFTALAGINSGSCPGPAHRGAAIHLQRLVYNGLGLARSPVHGGFEIEGP
jgi:hypothetical protein